MEFWIILYGATVFFSTLAVALDVLICPNKETEKGNMKVVLSACLIPAINLMIAAIAVASIIARRT